MNKKYILQSNLVINEIIKTNVINKNKNFVIYYRKNNLNYNRYCITIGKKLAKAYMRNKIKRRIKDILMKNSLNNSLDYVIIVRKPILFLKYEDIKEKLIGQLEEIKK